MPSGNLEVELIRGHGLKNVEARGKSDPYAVLTFGTVTHKSKVAQDEGSNPVWNESFLFPNIHEGSGNELEIALYDEEKRAKDIPMGIARIPLTHVFSHYQVPPTKYKVQLQNGKAHGELEISMKFLAKVHRGTLEVQLIDGHALLQADLISKTDPYVVITCEKKTQKSRVIKNSSDPSWNQNFLFEVNSDITEIRADLFDKDTFTSDDPLGYAIIPLNETFVAGQSPPTSYKVQRKNGQQQGEIRVGLKFTPKA